MSPRGVKGTGKPKGGVGPGKETPRWKPSLTEITSWALANGCRCGTWRCSPLVAPAWVLPRHLLDQHHDFSADRRPTAAVRAGPPPADQPPVPAQQRVRGHQAAHPQRPWEQPGRAASTARSAQSSLGFGFWRCSTATSWRSTSSSASFDAAERASSAIHPASRTTHQVEHPYRHKPAILPAQRPSRSTYSRVSYLCPFLEPHRCRTGVCTG